LKYAEGRAQEKLAFTAVLSALWSNLVNQSQPSTLCLWGMIISHGTWKFFFNIQNVFLKNGNFTDFTQLVQLIYGSFLLCLYSLETSNQRGTSPRDCVGFRATSSEYKIFIW